MDNLQIQYQKGKLSIAAEVPEQSSTMLKVWFKISDDGNNGNILMADCPNCGDAVIYNDGCVKCNTNFIFSSYYCLNFLV